MTEPRLLQLRIGRAVRHDGRVTAYAKAPQDGPVVARTLGLEGDEVGNKRVHGGPEKAVYAYGAAAYAGWIADHPRHAERLLPGAFGENLLIEGLDEATTCIGDRWRIGRALVEVCQPRQPCSTMARWFGDPLMVKAMVKNGRSGWYLRVLEDGAMSAGDGMVLEHRPAGAWTVAEVLAASYRSPPDRAELAALARVPGLAASWAAWAAGAAVSDKPRAKPL
jgi:MOSC domain-containing protein YiiM